MWSLACPPREAVSAAVLGALCFLWLFGVQPLDPANVGWLLHGDPAQHYLGWQFFRAEPWRWPLGRIEHFGAPLGTGIVFTDSIPLLALALKPVAAWLPPEFQYFGLWLLACYVLTAVFGWRLMARATPHPWLRALGTLFFLMSPALLLRAYGHESLMAQWLLLAGLDRYAASWRGGPWLALLVVAALTHSYLLLMLLALAAAAGARAIADKALAHPWRPLLIGLGALLLVMWGAGYFTNAPRSLAAEGYGHYSANLLTFVDPMDWHGFLRHYGRDTAGKQEWSQFLGPRGQATAGQYEGFAYLGLGLLALAALAAFRLLTRPPSRHTLRSWLPLLVVSALLFVAALSHQISAGGRVLVTLPWPERVLETLSVFRASGRFVWPLYYLLMWLALAVVVRRFAPRAALLLLAAGVALQFADLRGKFAEFRADFRALPAWQTPLTDPLWAELAGQFRHLVVVPPRLEGDAYIPLARFAARHGADINVGYVARPDNAALRAYALRLEDDLRHQRLQPDTLYVFPAGAGVTPPAGQAWRAADGYRLLLSGREAR